MKDSTSANFCPICGKVPELRGELLYCAHCKITVGRPGKYNQTYAHPKVEWRPKKEGVFNFFRVAKITLFLLFVFGASLWIYQAFIYEEQECVPVSSIYVFENKEVKKNVREAMKDILELSPEDYYRLCQFGTKIELRDLSGYWGYYLDREDPDTLKRGLILVDRKVAGQYEHLDAVLVHEACHAYLYQVFDDAREAPCEKRGYDYIAKKSDGVEGEEILPPSHGGAEGERVAAEKESIFEGEAPSLMGQIENAIHLVVRGASSYIVEEFTRLDHLVRKVNPL